MDYTIDKDSLYALVDEEVSKVANDAYSDTGESLYDSIVLTQKDRSTVERFMDDAANQLAKRAFDICKYRPEMQTPQGGDTPVATGRMKLDFYVPDFDSTMQDAVTTEIGRYIVLYVCASLFQQRRASLVEEYSARAQAAADKAVSLLKSRKDPMVSW